MKRLICSLAVLTAVAIAAQTADAAGPNAVAVNVASQAISHGGHHGHYGHHGPQYHYYGHGRPSVIVNPPVYYVPGPYRAPTVYYPGYYDRGYYGPRSGLQYYGRNFGFSIGF